MHRWATGMRVVLDTNVVVSALLFRSGRLSAVRTAWERAVLRPLVSRDTMGELTRVLAYPKFRLGPQEVQHLLQAYLAHAEVHAEVYAASIASRRAGRLAPGEPVCRDPHDQMFLRLAADGRAQALITGDADLLALRDQVRPRQTYVIRPPDDLVQWLAMQA